MFDVLKISRTEIRHSNMLGWLLNPNENHGMGDVFLKGIFQRLVENDSDGRYDIFNVLLMDFYTFSVMREWPLFPLLTKIRIRSKYEESMKKEGGFFEQFPKKL